MAERVIRRVGDAVHSLVTDHVTGTKHVEHFRKVERDMQPVIDRVKFLNDKVNQAPTTGNPNRHRYHGSVPVEILWDWLRERGYTMDQYARNEGSYICPLTGQSKGGLRDRFLGWFLTDRDMNRFNADTYR